MIFGWILASILVAVMAGAGFVSKKRYKARQAGKPAKPSEGSLAGIAP